MTPSRRNLLLAAGGCLGLVVTGGVWRVLRLPATAARPWEPDAQPPADVRLDAFRHAILAPNPHNRQPWRVRLLDKDAAIVTCDLDRRLPQTDPFDRQITIGFGAFLELMVLAAAARGVRADVTLFPDGEPQPRLDARPIAHIRFVQDPTQKPDLLFAHVLSRRSNKEPYDMARPVASDALAAFAAHDRPGLHFGGAVEPGAVAALRRLAAEAFHIETKTARTMKESADLLRVGAGEIDANPDGISLKGPMFEALSLLGADDVRAQAMDVESRAFKSTLARYDATFTATPAFLWLVTDANARRDQIAAGRAYVRANLDATARGLALAPVSQALQEFPEMAEPYARVHRLLGAKEGERVQMLVRLGYGPPVGPAARWPLQAKIVTA